MASAELFALLAAFGEVHGDQRAVFLPVLGYRTVTTLNPRYCDRWHRLLTRLREAQVDPEEWPHRLEGLAGNAAGVWWQAVLLIHGEGAVLNRLERLSQSKHRVRGHRGRGRPPWTTAEFDARYQEARARAGGRTTDKAIAEHFQDLSGERGMDSAYLSRLRRRRTHGKMPD